MDKEYFSVQKVDGKIELFSISMNGLSKGDIFFRRNKDLTTDALTDYNKEYINSIADRLLDGVVYDLDIINNKKM
jgi:hypothetical protein